MSNTTGPTLTQMPPAVIGEPCLDRQLHRYPMLQHFTDTNLHKSRQNAPLSKESFILHLGRSPPEVMEQLFQWTAASTGLSEDTLTLMECAHLFAQIFATALEDDLALKLLGNFQMHRLENQSVTKKPPRAQSSLDSEVAHLVWDSDLTDLDSDEDLFANFGSDSGDESDDENDEHALVDAIMPLPNLWTPPKNEPFDLFCRMVPDKYHATLWQSTFWANETWWPTLCAFWNAQLQSTFFPDSATHISVDEAYDFAVLVLRQMRKVKPKKGTLEWLDVLQVRLSVYHTAGKGRRMWIPHAQYACVL